MVELIRETAMYIVYPERFSPETLFIIQIVRALFITFSILGVAMIIFLLSRSGYLDARYIEEWSEFAKAKKAEKKKKKEEEKWNNLLKKAKSSDASERKLAVMDADEEINKVLSQMGYGDGTLEDKIPSIDETVITNIEELKKANRSRRDMDNDPNYSLPEEEAEKLILIYKETVRNIRSI